MELVKDEQETSEENTQKSQKLQRPDFKQTIFVGVQGVENNKKLIDSVKENFPDHHIYVFDKEIFNKTAEYYIKKHIKWQENQGVLEFCSKRENIQAAIQTAAKIQDAVGRDWFSMSEFVEKTNFTYPQAKEVFDLQYAFGFLAKDESTKQTKYLSLTSHEQQIEYLEEIRKGMDAELQEVDGILARMHEEANSTAINEGSDKE